MVFVSEISTSDFNIADSLFVILNSNSIWEIGQLYSEIVLYSYALMSGHYAV